MQGGRARELFAVGFRTPRVAEIPSAPDRMLSPPHRAQARVHQQRSWALRMQWVKFALPCGSAHFCQIHVDALAGVEAFRGQAG